MLSLACIPPLGPPQLPTRTVAQKKTDGIMSTFDPTAGLLAIHIGEARALVGSLDRPERDVLRQIVAGNSMLRISVHVECPLEDIVKIKAGIMRKLEANTTADLVRMGIYADV